MYKLLLAALLVINFPAFSAEEKASEDVELSKALKELDESNKKYEIATKYMTIADDAKRLGQFEKAFMYYEKAAQVHYASGIPLLLVADLTFYGKGTKRDIVKSGTIWFALATNLLNKRKEHSWWQDVAGEEALKAWNKNVNYFTKAEEELARQLGQAFLESDFKYTTL